MPTLLLDSWLRHTADTMRLQATVLQASPTQSALSGWAKEIEIAADLIAEHNKTVLARCNDKKTCGWEVYSIRCPSCPMEFVLEWPVKEQS